MRESESNNDKRFDTASEALQDGFASKHLGDIKRGYRTEQMVLPPRERQDLSLASIIEVGYVDNNTNTAYFVNRFVGLEFFLPASERHYFRDNRAAHAATEYLGTACHIYESYQHAQRYEREKEIFMDWKIHMTGIARRYQLQPQQLADNIKPAFNAVALLKPHYIPMPPEILSFEESHNVSRKRNIIFGIN